MPVSVRLKKSNSMKIAYSENRMAHMKKVWRKNKKRWAIKNNPRWKPLGTKREDGHGYTLIKVAEGKGFKNWQQEHRFVMEKYLKRKMKKSEVVHHINHNKSDNRLLNLRLLTSHAHKSLQTEIK